MGGRSGIGFGLLIAFVLPGFTVLAALSLLFEPLQVWLLGPAGESPAVGGVLYVTAASVLIGQLLNVLRWAVLDSVFEATGIKRPTWDEQRLPERLQAFEALVENHYRYFQFYGNMALAIPIAWLAFRFSVYSGVIPHGPLELGVLVLELTLIAGSRDALRRYFLRSQTLLGKDSSAMTNGHHPKPQPPKQPEAKTPKAEAPKSAKSADRK